MRSNTTVVAAVIALALIGLAAILFTAPGNESSDRLALLFAVLAPTVVSLLALLRSDQAASNTNGKLDARMQAAVHRANTARRRGDAPATPAQLEALPSTPPLDPDPDR